MQQRAHLERLMLNLKINPWSRQPHWCVCWSLAILQLRAILFFMREFSSYSYFSLVPIFFFSALQGKIWCWGREERQLSAIFFPNLKITPPLKSLDKIFVSKKKMQRTKWTLQVPVVSDPSASINSLCLRPRFVGIYWKYPTSITHHFQDLLSSGSGRRQSRACS